MALSSMSRAKDPMQKKLVKNKKYSNIKPTIDTGASLSKYLSKMEEIQQNFRYRKNEIFRRMKVTTFVQLILQVHEINSMDANIPENEYHDGEDSIVPEDSVSVRDSVTANGLRVNKLSSLTSDTQHEVDVRCTTRGSSCTDKQSDYSRSSDSPRSTFQSLIHGIGEADVNSKENSIIPPLHEPLPCPYLLLDIRDADSYKENHIVTARHYPIAMLSRACNYETAEMLHFKNRAGCVIILYDNDERIAPNAACTLVERGYNNIFMLSGGMKVSAKLFPKAFLSESCLSKGRADVESVVSITSPKAAGTFTTEHIFILKDQLDDILYKHAGGLESFGGSKVGSRASTADSKISVTAARYLAAKSSAAKPIFRP